MQPPEVAVELLARLYQRAGGARWDLPRDAFRDALLASAAKAFAGRELSARELGRYVEGLHLEDLALACACAAGNEAAWEHFVCAHRPVLYRAADAIDPSGGARELADSLYADLYGVTDRGPRPSLFRYFHGRSSLGTWLRAVLAQRHVDRVRAGRRLQPLPDEDAGPAVVARTGPTDPDRNRYSLLLQRTLGAALARIDARDRLRLGCYYAQAMTLAEIGKLLGEHEATVSRHLARTRRVLRHDVEHQLRTEDGLSDAEIAECFESVMSDAGSMDLTTLMAASDARKKTVPDRST